ncbi:hypothetical protein Scep_007291 [Stephania cephalantha]|uniref:Uncharacterized protein n=1 Tax=Stephania cephalantha TaxID=152367 RepID=A0AAP0KBK5_9MAGN
MGVYVNEFMENEVSRGLTGLSVHSINDDDNDIHISNGGSDYENDSTGSSSDESDDNKDNDDNDDGDNGGNADDGSGGGDGGMHNNNQYLEKYQDQRQMSPFNQVTHENQDHRSCRTTPK